MKSIFKATFSILMLFIFSSMSVEAAGKIAITIDDLPCVGPRTRSPAKNIEMMVESFKRHKVVPTGFVCGDRGNYDAVKVWHDAGFSLGNHTFSHPHLSKMKTEDYIQNIEKNEQVYFEKLGVKIAGTYFRYPFLDHGNSQEKVDAMEAFFKRTGYKIAHVSLDTADYLFATEVAKAADKNEIQKMYLEHLSQCAQHFASVSSDLFKREIPLIMLLHANELNAEMMDDILKMFQNKGWEFISLDEAMKDSVYSEYYYRVPMPVCPGDRNLLNQFALKSGLQIKDISGDRYFNDYWKKRIEK